MELRFWHPGDKRLLAWVNEAAVLVAIARKKNQPTYVAEMVRLVPEVKGTKPGMGEAAKRLCDYGVLQCLDGVAPRKNAPTPHYSIISTIQALTTIHHRYGSWTLDDLRKSGFTGMLIDERMKAAPEGCREEISYLTRKSTAALMAFLDSEYAAGGRSLCDRLAGLRDSMHLAFAAEVIGVANREGWAEGWDIGFDIKTVILSGGATFRLETDFDSEKFRRMEK